MDKFNRAWEKQNASREARQEQESNTGEEEIAPPKSEEELAGEFELTPEAAALKKLEHFQWIKSESHRQEYDEEEEKYEWYSEYEFHSVDDFMKRIDPAFLQNPKFWAAMFKDEDIRKSINLPFSSDRDIKYLLYKRVPESIKSDPAILTDLINFFDQYSVLEYEYFTKENYEMFRDEETFKKHPEWHKGNWVFADLYRRKEESGQEGKST